MTGPIKPFEPVATAPRPRSDDCGGAFVRITGEMKREFERSGIVFVSVFKSGERLDCRKRCDGTIEIKGDVRYGLCSACSAFEAHVRRTLKETK